MISTTNLTYIKDIEYNNASEFLTSLSYGGELYKVFGKNFIFRGQSDHNYKLLPSALRGNLCKEWHKSCKEESLNEFILSNSEYLQIEAEVEILSSFFNTCDMNKLHVPLTDRLRESVLLQIDPWALFQKENWLPKDYYEIAALAQHYGLPTRLLDWTYDINVALYFASMEVIKGKCMDENLTESEWLNKVKDRNRKTLASLKGHLQGNLSKETDGNSNKEIELWALDTNIIFANKTNNFPLRIIRPRYYDNDNLSAQKGLFTLWVIEKPLKKDFKPDFGVMVDRTPLDKQITDYLKQAEMDPKPYLYHITIPQSAVGEIYEYAKRNHIDAAHLFPGYAGVVQCLKEDNLLKEFNSLQRNLQTDDK